MVSDVNSIPPLANDNVTGLFIKACWFHIVNSLLLSHCHIPQSMTLELKYLTPNESIKQKIRGHVRQTGIKLKWLTGSH